MLFALVQAALRSIILALVIRVGLQIFRIHNIALQRCAWTAVLIGSLLMPFALPFTAHWHALPVATIPTSASLDRLQSALAPIQHRGKIPRLIIRLVYGQAFLHRLARFGDLVRFLQQHREADARIDAARVRCGSLRKTGSRPLRLAQGLVLMPNHPDEFGIVRFEFDGLAPGAVRQFGLVGLEGGVAIFIPDHRRAGTVACQFLVERERPGIIASQQRFAGRVEKILEINRRHGLNLRASVRFNHASGSQRSQD